MSKRLRREFSPTWHRIIRGYDNEHIYLKYMGFGPSKLKKLKEAGII